ncbi:MAG: PKD domain-containing protein [Candidatus Pacebacteria bacterium]|nr:PKD domain-containing protein [Candidatus Paceibacterota bacterium]
MDIVKQELLAFSEYLSSPEGELNSASIMSSISSLVEKHQALFADLMNVDPYRAIHSAFTPSDIDGLPSAVAAIVAADGTQVTLTGKFEKIHSDSIDPNDPIADQYFLLLSDGTEQPLQFTGEAPEINSTVQVTITGLMQGGILVVAPISQNVLNSLAHGLAVTSGDVKATAGVGIDPAHSTGTHTYLDILFKYPEQPSGIPEDPATELANLKAWSAELNRQTLGRLTIIPTVTQVFVLPQSASYYASVKNGFSLASADAKKLAIAAGFDPNKFDFVSYRFNADQAISACAGLAVVGGKTSWRVSGDEATFIHELAHNAGLNHANFENDQDGAVIGSGYAMEYGDPNDIQGGNMTVGIPPKGFNVAEQAVAHWIDPAQITSLSPSSNSGGTYRIYASDQGAKSGVKYALDVTKDATRHYMVGLLGNIHTVLGSTVINMSAAPNFFTSNGVMLYFTSAPNIEGSALVTTHQSMKKTIIGHLFPDSSAAALLPGETFCDKDTTDGGVCFTLLRRDNSTTPPSADMSVKFGSFPGNQNPNAPVITVPDSVAAYQNATFTATASDPDGDPVTLSWNFGDGTYSTDANATSVSKMYSVPGTYTVTVTAYDGKGGKTQSASKTIAVTSGTPPNDNFANATVLSGATPTGAGSNVGATSEAGEPAEYPGLAGTKKSVWYRWTAPANAHMVLDTAGSRFATMVSIFTGSAVNALSLVADEKPTNGVYHSGQVSWDAVLGTTYNIALYGIDATGAQSAGDFTFAVSTVSQATVDAAVADTPPTIAEPASASPSTTPDNTTQLHVSGADDKGEPSLTYYWTVKSVPSGAHAMFYFVDSIGRVIYASPIGHDAKNLEAIMSGPGQYVFEAHVKDTAGHVVTSDVTVTATAEAEKFTTIAIHPPFATTYPAPATEPLIGKQYYAVALNQRGNPMTTSANISFNWSVNGGATFTSIHTVHAETPGEYTVTASAQGVTGTGILEVLGHDDVVRVNIMRPNNGVSIAVLANSDYQFNAIASNISGVQVVPQPAKHWSVNGGGAIDEATGLLHVGSTLGRYVVSVKTGPQQGITDSVEFVVTNDASLVQTTHTNTPQTPNIPAGAEPAVNSPTVNSLVSGSLPKITSNISSSATVGQAWSYPITASNNPTGFGVTNPASWMSVNTATGVISGTPTGAGTYRLIITATNATGKGSAILTLTIASNGVVANPTPSSSTPTPTPVRSATPTPVPPVADSSQTVAKISISPTSPSVSRGGSQQFTAVVQNANGDVLSTAVHWSTNITSTHRIDANGLFTSDANDPIGSAAIIASVPGTNGTATKFGYTTVKIIAP